MLLGVCLTEGKQEGHTPAGCFVSPWTHAIRLPIAGRFEQVVSKQPIGLG